MSGVGQATVRVTMPIGTRMRTEGANATNRSGSRGRDHVSYAARKLDNPREAITMWVILWPVVCAVSRACAIIAWTVLRELCPLDKNAFVENLVQANPHLN